MIIEALFFKVLIFKQLQNHLNLLFIKYNKGEKCFIYHFKFNLKY